VRYRYKLLTRFRILQGDGRWIPYEEHVADKLEEEYQAAAKVNFFVFFPIRPAVAIVSFWKFTTAAKAFFQDMAVASLKIILACEVIMEVCSCQGRC
jgi:hypothetical protein